ncbi:SDR family NAD(P)-dependent oxidoreductase [Leptolyngbya sp. AN03gr2]|uniref:SDR family NAD(P)-dependent oxidoreductase n=1 Tax=unclassified Leptolyngbya TaxID=2650499 RepID=UPI003D323EBF
MQDSARFGQETERHSAASHFNIFLSFCAERLGREGATVALTYAGNRDKAEAVVATLKGFGVDALAIQSDISNIAETRSLFEKVIQAFGQVGIVVNNVGVSVYKPTVDITEADFDKVFNTNAKGTFFAL